MEILNKILLCTTAKSIYAKINCCLRHQILTQLLKDTLILCILDKKMTKNTAKQYQIY